MIKKTIKFTDLSGKDRSEDFYFHMNKAEVTLLTAQLGGDLNTAIEQLVAAKNLGAMIEFIQEMILKAVGARTADGTSFIKNDEIRHAFEYSEAFAELFEELLMNPNAAQEFGQGIVAKGDTPAQQPQTTVPFVQKQDVKQVLQDATPMVEAAPDISKMTDAQKAALLAQLQGQ